MSVATLKKKTQAKYNNMSVGQNQFSLNGTHRSQGWVGQSMLSRSLPKTLMQGKTPKGYGGCCGTYDTSQGITQSAVVSLNNINIVKPSVISNKGMLEEKLTPYRNYLMPYPYVSTIPTKHVVCITVKDMDSSSSSHDTGIYIENLATSTCSCTDSIRNNQKYSGCADYNAYHRRKICNLVSVQTNKNGSIVHIDADTNIEGNKGSRLLCDDYSKVTPDQYNEIYAKKGIRYNAAGTYVFPANPSNGTILPGPLSTY
jgi:hypothetical protein